MGWFATWAKEQPCFYVYRLYDVDDVLLYVGWTADVNRRFAAHRWTSPFYDYVWRIDKTTYQTWREVKKAERLAIAAERPLFNITYNPAYDADEVRRYLEGDHARF